MIEKMKTSRPGTVIRSNNIDEKDISRINVNLCVFVSDILHLCTNPCSDSSAAMMSEIYVLKEELSGSQASNDSTTRTFS